MINLEMADEHTRDLRWEAEHDARLKDRARTLALSFAN